MGASAAAWVPLCMDMAEHAAWMAANQRLSSDRAPRPCTDCPLGFAAEMRSEGRCNGTPGGVEEDEMDEIVTEVPAARQTPRKHDWSDEQRAAAAERARQMGADRKARKAAAKA